jgi:SAM-dependent methyltransferase
MKSHYDKNYFEWQKEVGELSASACSFLFEPYVKPGHSVLDFGCGGGFILSRLRCAHKYGVEVNPSARDEAARNGLTVLSDLGEMKNASVDVVISNHALEHVRDPLGELRRMRQTLKPGGRLVLVTPFERGSAWRPADKNQHLYTWSPMNLGNLVTSAGFKVESAVVISHRFPPFGLKIRKAIGGSLFHLLCRAWGSLYYPVTQVRVVAIVEEI